MPTANRHGWSPLQPSIDAQLAQRHARPHIGDADVGGMIIIHNSLLPNARSFDNSASAGSRPAAEADKDSLWRNYLLPIQRIRDGAINAVAAVPTALIQTK